MVSGKPNVDAGAGFVLKSDDLPSGDTHPRDSMTSRALALSTYFLSGALSINLSQFIGAPLRLIDEDWYNAWIAFTKQSFGLLTMALTQAFAPTTVVVSGDASVRGQIRKDSDGSLSLEFPPKLVMIANHQIYTDWLYLWWVAYCSKMHGHLYIVLKESLKRIPILGWGMQLSQFIFLKRNWEQDKPHMAEALQRLNKLTDPVWLLLFPEGTNLAPDTRLKSAAWAAKSNVRDCQHVLLPRSTGLQFCLEQLENTVDYLYDCTVAYEGVPRGQYAQDIFTLKAGYLQGRPPKSVSMYWRRFAIKDIPVHNEKAFGLWLTARWREKDLLIENYHRFGRFPSDIGISKTARGKTLRGCGLLSVQIRPSHWYEFLQVFAPMGILAMVLYIFYGALPQNVWNSISDEALQASTNEIKQLKQKSQNVKGVSGSLDLSSFFDKDKQNETFQRIGLDLMSRLQTPEAKGIMTRANLVQKWLEDPKQFVLDNLEGEAPEKTNFLMALQEEENKRRGIGHGPHQGTFWKDVEALTNARSSGVRKEDATIVDAAPQLVVKTLPRRPQKQVVGVNARKNGSFWADLNSEENSRRSSIAPRPGRSTDAKSTKAKTTQPARAMESPRPVPSSSTALKQQRRDAEPNQPSKQNGSGKSVIRNQAGIRKPTGVVTRNDAVSAVSKKTVGTVKSAKTPLNPAASSGTRPRKLP